MATNKRAVVERMEVKTRYSGAQQFACAETVIVLFMLVCALLFVLALNAILPSGW